MKIVCISDTHNWGIPLASLPEGDVLIHAGDGTMRGTERSIRELAKELGKHLKDSRYHKGYKAVIFVPGNHDWLFAKEPELARKIMADEGVITLINESYIFEGVKFWGSPVTSPFGYWAFQLDDKERDDVWETIPDDTDVVITHSPPQGILDEVKRHFRGMTLSQSVGCRFLDSRIRKIKPKLHVFGHIHPGYGMKKIDETIYVNAALMDDSYSIVNQPIAVEI